MDKILSLQKMQAVEAPEEEVEEGGSDWSITCDGNSCISFNCGGAAA